MGRIVYIIRHAQNAGTRFNQADFGKEGASLIEAGIQESLRLTPQLQKLGINVGAEPVAVSELVRTQQTATHAGFTHLAINSLLNEVKTEHSPDTLELMLKTNQLPVAARTAAHKLLANPPREKVWVTHGLLIAGIAAELGLTSHELFIPTMGSLTTIQLP